MPTRLLGSNQGPVGMRHRKYFLGRGQRKQGLRGRDRGGEAAQTGFPSLADSGRLGPRFLLWGGVGVGDVRDCTKGLGGVPQLWARSEGLRAGPRAGKGELRGEEDEGI